MSLRGIGKSLLFIKLILCTLYLCLTHNYILIYVAAKEPGSIPKKLEVSLQLCHQFPPTIILSTASQLINYLCQLPVDKGKIKTSLLVICLRMFSNKMFTLLGE